MLKEYAAYILFLAVTTVLVIVIFATIELESEIEELRGDVHELSDSNTWLRDQIPNEDTSEGGYGTHPDDYEEGNNPFDEPNYESEFYDIPQYDYRQEEDLHDPFPFEDVEELSAEDLLAFSSNDEARQDFLNENTGNHFWLPREWEYGSQQELFLPLMLEAGFRDFAISSNCPLEHAFYAEKHIGESGDSDITVDIYGNSEIETYLVDMTVLDDGVILLEYSGWLCGSFPEELPLKDALST